MKNRWMRFAGIVIFAGMLLGNTFAQGVDKQTRREVKRELKEERSTDKWDRWTLRQESKRAKQLENERRFNDPSTARGSEITFIDPQGRSVKVGYIDRFNNFKPYPR